MQFAKVSVFHIFHTPRRELWARLWNAARLLTGERARSVDARGVPEEVALGLRVTGGHDLATNVVQGVLPAEGEVLQPGNEPGLLAAEGEREIPQREGDRARRLCVWIRQVELTRAVMGGVDHRVDGVEVGGELPRPLANSHVARRREPEDIRGDPHAERLQALAGVLEEPHDGRGLGLLGLALVDGGREVAVGREADVVELDLVEARLCRSRGDVHVVLPDPLVVRVGPAEPAARQPDAAAAALNGHTGLPAGEVWVLEDDDAADEVD